MPYTVIRQIVRRNREETVTTEVGGAVLRIGRGTDNDLHLEDLSVRYAHASIERVHGGFVLRDATETRATYVNHAPVREARLRDGDVVRIGPYSLAVAIPGTDDRLILTVTEDASVTADEAVSLSRRYGLAGGRINKVSLSVFACLAVLAVSVLAFALGHHRLFMPGDVSAKHSLFGNDCLACHQPWKPVWALVPDRRCQACHSGPSHFGDRSGAPAPACASCHREHHGRVALTAVRDQGCVQCHAGLDVTDPSFDIVREIHAFGGDHPEFAVSVRLPGTEDFRRVRFDGANGTAAVDPATLKLNHKLHLEPRLMGPDGPEKLRCGSCHVPDAQGAYMLPINYEQHCLRCHRLDFDDRLPGAQVTHGRQPEAVRTELQAMYSSYYVLTRGEELRGRRGVKRLPGGPRSKEELFVDEMTARAERYLYSGKTRKCLLCHAVEEGANGLPVVAPTGVPSRWLPYSRFGHTAHYGLPEVKVKGCAACHAGAEASETTADVLLPAIDSCRTCHFEPDGADASCVECHVYHHKATQVLAPVSATSTRGTGGP